VKVIADYDYIYNVYDYIASGNGNYNNWDYNRLRFPNPAYGSILLNVFYLL